MGNHVFFFFLTGETHWTASKIFLIARKTLYCIFQGVYYQQIVISYKELSWQTFTSIDVDRNFSLHVSEAFRNPSPCGSDIYQQVYLKVRESDSLLSLKRHSDLKEASAESMSTKQFKSPLSSFASSVNSERLVVADVCEWKTSKGNQLSQKLQSQNVQ